MAYEEDPRLTDLEMTVITITVDGDGVVTMDSDVDAGETLLILERVRLMVVVPEWFEADDED